MPGIAVTSYISDSKFNIVLLLATFG